MSLFALFSVSYHADYDTVICHNCHVLSIEIACLSLYSVDSLRALICYCFVNYCLLY